MKYFWKQTTTPTITTLDLNPPPGRSLVRFVADCFYGGKHVTSGTMMEIPTDDALDLAGADRIAWLSARPTFEPGVMPVQQMIRQRLQQVRRGKNKPAFIDSWRNAGPGRWSDSL